jgi:hypothetical protein
MKKTILMSLLAMMGDHTKIMEGKKAMHVSMAKMPANKENPSEKATPSEKTP